MNTTTFTPGVELIAVERARQINEEGHAPVHDDAYDKHELAEAAVALADPCPDEGGKPWPWLEETDKRPRDEYGQPMYADEMTPPQRIRQLVKAGALIAAEIDRLQRLQAKGND